MAMWLYFPVEASEHVAGEQSMPQETDAWIRTLVSARKQTFV